MTTPQSTVPRPTTARELKAVLEAERVGTPFLLFRDGEAGQRIVALEDSSRTRTLGRGERNDVVIDWDPQVSAVHAELHCTGGEWTIADDGLSSNGTYVNGSRLGGRMRLRDGDHLRLGQSVFLFRSDVASQAAGTAAAGHAPTVERLSERQRRVLVALCRPCAAGGNLVTPATNQEIAAELYLSVDAVKNHLRVLFAKFELEALPQNQKRARLVETALRWGLVAQRDF